MLVRDINKILKDKNMQNVNTNLKVVKNKRGSGKGYKKLTTRDLILQIISRLDKVEQAILGLSNRVDNLVDKNDLKE